MSKEFDNIIMSKFKDMPVTLLFDERHRNMTDEQFEKVKNYIRQLMDEEDKPIIKKEEGKK